MGRFEYFEHLADMGIIGWGASLAQAFEEAAKAMFNLMVEIDQVEPKQRISIRCQGGDREELFVEWLNALLTEADINGMVFSRFSVESLTGEELSGWVKGEGLDPERHHAKTEVKAATYSGLAVGEKGGEFYARCVVDL
jgi:SHS2 domain-containing protein